MQKWTPFMIYVVEEKRERGLPCFFNCFNFFNYWIDKSFSLWCHLMFPERSLVEFGGLTTTKTASNFRQNQVLHFCVIIHFETIFLKALLLLLLLVFCLPNRTFANTSFATIHLKEFASPIHFPLFIPHLRPHFMVHLNNLSHSKH